MGFSSPPSEPDVHLSLCIRLSKGFRKVRRPHPIERKPHHRDLAHLVLLNAVLGPDPRAGIRPAGPTPSSVQPPAGSVVAATRHEDQEVVGIGAPFGAYANGFVSVEALRPGGSVDVLDARDDLDPPAYAKHALGWAAAGATILGGCCEIGPAHIAELARQLGREGYAIAAEPEYGAPAGRG